MKTARDLMTSPAECLEPTETLVDAARKLAQHDIGSMPVVDGDQLVGILTDRDIVVEAVAKGRDPNQTKVADIATSKVVTVAVNDSAESVAKVLAEGQIRRVPVVEAGKVVGVIAQADVATELDDSTVAETVEEISKS